MEGFCVNISRIDFTAQKTDIRFGRAANGIKHTLLSSDYSGIISAMKVTRSNLNLGRITMTLSKST